MLALILFAAPTWACAQQKPKRMIQGPSVKELAPESPSQNEDGITQICFGLLFKPGTTEYTRVGMAGIKDRPPLPTGYRVFKDLVYQVTSEAIIAGSQITVFNLPSVENEIDFKNLSLLHLEWDELSPAGFSWADVTVFSGGWDEHFHSVSKARYDAMQPNFKLRQIAATTHEFGLFAIALAPDSGLPSTGPFTQIEVSATSSPEPVRVGDEVTHMIVVKNKGPKAAAEVNFKASLGSDLDFFSVTPNQGTCKRSTQSSDRVLCYLGALPSGAVATVAVVARVRDNILSKDGDKVGNMIELVFKERPTDFVVEDIQVFKDFTTTIVKKQ